MGWGDRVAAAVGRRWAVPAAIAVPFVAAVAALRGMTVALPIFHGSDELVYQYPTILQFSRQLPLPDLHSYRAAQTPLFHLLMALAGQLVGLELWRLRLLAVAISYALGLAVFSLLHRRLGIERLRALALTLLFILSPYVFGQSFRLLTDDLALLFSVLAIERLQRFHETDRLGPFLAGCACVAAAILTRQSTAFLLGLAALYAVRPRATLTVRTRLLALLAVALAALPAGLLFLNWHGLVPVGGDPGSCGLCRASTTAGAGAHGGGLEVQSAELALATIGLYGAVLFAPVLLAGIRGRAWDWRRSLHAGAVPLATVSAGALLLVAFPARPGAHAAGDIWKLAARLPSIDGSSLLFWLLVPLGGAVLLLRLRRPPRPWLARALPACFLVSAVVIRYPWQKYVDPFALLVLVLTVRDRELHPPWRLAGAAVLAVVFLGYALDLSSHRSTPPGATAPIYRGGGLDRAAAASLSGRHRSSIGWWIGSGRPSSRRCPCSCAVHPGSSAAVPAAVQRCPAAGAA
ncbi:MAG: glycosyltransferase family 39 protein [Actinomycetota bacterium]|nr:glycosyltransferase family 39 protein [Actinomycetota bacterium]